MTGESRMNAPQTPTNPKEAMMACMRCHGLMVKETLFNPGEGLTYTWVPVARCLNCGNVEDELIRFARGISPRLGGPTKPGPQRRGVWSEEIHGRPPDESAAHEGYDRLRPTGE